MKGAIAKPPKPFMLGGEVAFTPMLIGAQAKCSDPYCAKRGEWRPFDDFGFRMDERALRNQPQCTHCRHKAGSNFGKSSTKRLQSYSGRLTVGGLWLAAVFHEVVVWCPGREAIDSRGHWTRRFDMEVVEQPTRQLGMFADATEITVRNTTACKRCSEGKRNDTFQPKR